MSVMRVVAFREGRWWATGLGRASLVVFVGRRDGRVLNFVLWNWRRGGRTMVPASSMSSATVLEGLEWPLSPRVLVRRFVCFVVAVAAEGRMVKALTLEVGHEVPEWGRVVVVSYVRHDDDV